MGVEYLKLLFVSIYANFREQKQNFENENYASKPFWAQFFPTSNHQTNSGSRSNNRNCFITIYFNAFSDENEESWKNYA